MKNNKNTYIMLIPWILVFLIFWLYPILYTGYLSLTDYQTLTNSLKYVGLKNYKAIFNDNIFWIALRNTVLFTLGTVPFTVSIALILANLLNNKLVKFRNFFRASYFLPSVTSLVVISLIFTNLYSSDGYINIILKSLGLPTSQLGWLNNTKTSLLSIMIMDIWSACGYYMVIFLAAIQSIPEHLYDAAKLVGAKPFYVLRRITIPLIKPTIAFVLIVNIIKSFQVFMEIYIMTKGGPLNSTTTLVYMIFTNAFEKTDTLGYASAIAYVLFILLLIISFFQLKFMKNTN
ncbi:MAG: sugar ABC transporter permease [Bacteroidetes bacterium]|nr:sugar ABC transporter permease [Bacteroidota bacterium]